MRDLFDDFMEELRKREATARAGADGDSPDAAERDDAEPDDAER